MLERALIMITQLQTKKRELASAALSGGDVKSMKLTMNDIMGKLSANRNTVIGLMKHSFVPALGELCTLWIRSNLAKLYLSLSRTIRHYNVYNEFGCAINHHKSLNH